MAARTAVELIFKDAEWGELKNKLVFIIAIVFGLLTAGIIYSYITAMEQSLDTTEYVNIVVATKALPAKTVIDSSMVSTKKIPKEYMHPQEITDSKQVVGNFLRVPITEGQSFYKEHLLKPGETKDGLAFIVPKGKRALTIPVDEVSGIAGLIKPGDRVDVITTIAIDEDPYTIIAVQDIPVLAVGKEMDRKNDVKEINASTITVAVNYDEAKPLMMASQRGAIRLMLRSPLDGGKGPAAPFRLEDFLK